MKSFREKNEEFFRSLAEFQKTKIDIEINKEQINKLVKLNNVGVVEEEESMLLN